MSDSDEYAAYDFAEFTDADFTRIDAAIHSGNFDSLAPQGRPAVPIQLEPTLPTVVTEKAKQGCVELSPLQRHRPRNTLSVTDLVSPAWCEVQFDYGLRQKRSRELEHRPDSFVSGEGKEIFVQKAVAARNDQVVKRGKSVHKELEREIMPKSVDVYTNSDEERWAVRLVNMLSCLTCLMKLGCAREMPVFGVVDNQIVVGVIDEVLRRPISQAIPPVGTKRESESSLAAPEPKKARRAASPSQSHITEFSTSPQASPRLSSIPDPDDVPLPDNLPAQEDPSSFPSPSLSGKITHNYSLHLIDTKTRRTNSLPSDEDSQPSRLQLMLYHRLLNDLIRTSPPFDFSMFWATLYLNPSEPFSPQFLSQTGLIWDGGDLPTTCLNDLTTTWIKMVQQLDVSGVDTTLQLIYRLQPNAARRKRVIAKTDTLIDVTANRSDDDRIRTAEASMDDVGASNTTRDDKFAKALVESLDNPSQNEEGSLAGMLAADPDFFWAIQESLLTCSKQDGVVDRREDPSIEPSPKGPVSTDDTSHIMKATKIIGTKEFSVDESFLNSYLVDVLRWWRGDRKPRGVALEQSGRCFSCEYSTGCEWRAQKALEIGGGGAGMR